MPEFDRTKWNARYADPAAAPREPARLIVSLADWLPKRGKALDVAGGAGRNAIWLASLGLDVTLADISATGLALAQRRAAESGHRISALEVDLQVDEFPAGPWDVILSTYYLWRPLYASFPQALAPGGMLVIVQPTVRNLERNPKPPPPFLLEEREVLRLAGGLEILRYEEGWLAEDRHEALLIARRPRVSAYL